MHLQQRGRLLQQHRDIALKSPRPGRLQKPWHSCTAYMISPCICNGLDLYALTVLWFCPPATLQNITAGPHGTCLQRLGPEAEQLEGGWSRLHLQVTRLRIQQREHAFCAVSACGQCGQWQAACCWTYAHGSLQV